MKANKQAQELEAKINSINEHYNEMHRYIMTYDPSNHLFEEIIEDIIDKAKAWDIFRAKCAKGAKVASANLSRKERIDRARHASLSKNTKEQKEKALKKVRH